MNAWLLVIIAIVLAVALGYKTKVNIGLYALAFAFLIGCFFMGMKPKAVLALWPLTIFFVLLSVMFFYSFAMSNGTLEKFASYILYGFRHHPAVLPYVLFVIALLLAAMGAGFHAIVAFVMPLTFVVCKKTGMSPLIGVLASGGGAAAGAEFFISATGVLVNGLVTSAGYVEEAHRYTWIIFAVVTITQFILLNAGMLVTRYWKTVGSESLDFSKPEPFNNKQKINLALIIFLMCGMVIPPVLANIFKDGVIALIASKVDVGFFAVICSILALLFKVGDEKEQLKAVPWGTIILVSGVGLLIALGVEAGMVDALSVWLGERVSPVAVPAMLILAAGCMSVFSSTSGVVLPTLFPMVPAIAAVTPLSPILMFCLINMGSLATGYSPFSSCGSIALGAAPDSEIHSKLFNQLLITPFANIVLTLVEAYIFMLIL